eukprot:2038164-Amphidinium_carterae.1
MPPLELPEPTAARTNAIDADDVRPVLDLTQLDREGNTEGDADKNIHVNADRQLLEHERASKMLPGR